MISPGLFLGVHRGHGASCALMRNGKIILAAQEERFSRIKNDIGYPYRALEWLFNEADICGSDIDRAAYSTVYFPSVFTKSKHRVQFSQFDYLRYYSERDVGDRLSILRWLRDDSRFNQHQTYYDFSWLSDEVLNNHQADRTLFQLEQKRFLNTHLGVPLERISFLDHHSCHAHYAYFASPFRDKDCIIITIDGGGDGCKQTVWRAVNNELQLLARGNENEVGTLYKLVTLLIGMRPDEEEYKVMGLAPYAKESKVAECLNVFRGLLRVEEMQIVHDCYPAELFPYLRTKLSPFRFDVIAGALQLYVEELLCLLVRDIDQKVGCRRLVLSGGVSMNIKANLALSRESCVEELFIPGSGGDESLSLGACYVLNELTRTPSVGSVKLDDMYLGYDATKDSIPEEAGDNFSITEEVDYEFIAYLLAEGYILGWIQGRAEFGARALGNRSILAAPNIPTAKERINKAIKRRDFWMPFAISIMEEHAESLIINPKNLKSPFMTLGFESQPDSVHRIVAGVHPADYTVRPQIVSKSTNPTFHELLSAFYDLTRIPALLNTSFNIHGEPIVNSFTDALCAFRRSELDLLLLNRTLLSKTHDQVKQRIAGIA